MGKGDQHHPPLPPAVTHPQSPAASQPHTNCSKLTRLFRFKCLFVLVLGLSVLLSALFWLPPFFSHGDQEDLHLDSPYKGYDIVATFMIQKPLSLLQDDFQQLEGDIFDDIRVPTAKVVILTAEGNDQSNTTKVIFGVDHDEYNSKISSFARSIVRDSFVSLVLKQSPLGLTKSLFGEPFFFEVLKFVGGVTVTPVQSAYPLQKVQIQFNFTLNFSIQQILDHFGELTSQLKSGLRLDPYENLHVSLTNSKGSTVAPHTTVQSSVFLVIGTPSMARSKQLAQTIRGSPAKNLGLNNTQFGRVKQISLSSYYNDSSGGRGTPTPSPAPLPNPPQPNHNHHHHHDKQLPPAKPPSPSKPSPAPLPVPTSAPHNIHNAKPPDCRHGYTRKKKSSNKHHPMFRPVSQPAPSPHTPPPRPVRNLPPPPQTPPPSSSLQPPPLPPPVTETIPASAPLPNVVFAHTHPPAKSDSDAEPPDMSPSDSFLQPSSACEGVALGLRATMTFVAAIILQQL